MKANILPFDKNGRKFQEILQKNKVERISIFGSWATGEMREDSDLDFLVEFHESADLLDMVGVKLDLEELPGKRVDVVTRNSISPYLRDKIMGQAIPL